MVWALYAERWRALQAIDTMRFGHANWAVYERPERAPTPWVLYDLGLLEEPDPLMRGEP